jgi:hypothetical protein
MKGRRHGGSIYTKVNTKMHRSERFSTSIKEANKSKHFAILSKQDYFGSKVLVFGCGSRHSSNFDENVFL